MVGKFKAVFALNNFKLFGLARLSSRKFQSSCGYSGQGVLDIEEDGGIREVKHHLGIIQEIGKVVEHDGVGIVDFAPYGSGHRCHHQVVVKVTVAVHRHFLWDEAGIEQVELDALGLGIEHGEEFCRIHLIDGFLQHLFVDFIRFHS